MILIISSTCASAFIMFIYLSLNVVDLIYSETYLICPTAPLGRMICLVKTYLNCPTTPLGRMICLVKTYLNCLTTPTDDLSG